MFNRIIKGDSTTADQDINIQAEGVASLTVIDCNIHKIGHAGIKTDGALTAKGNYIHDGGFTNRDHGIYIYGTSTSQKLIEHNAFVNISGAGVHNYNGGNENYPQNVLTQANVFLLCLNGVLAGGRNNQYISNTFSRNTRGLHIWATESAGVVYNNIAYGNTDWDVAIGSEDTRENWTFDDNLFGSTTPVTGWNGIAEFTDNPLFADGASSDWFDYTLQGGSPAIGVGSVRSGVTLLNPAIAAQPTEDPTSDSTTLGAFSA